MKVYQYIRENGGWENFDMIEIEKYPCNDANEARKRERYWFEELNAKLNQIYPSGTKQEYKDSIKEKMKIYFQEYNNNNKEKRAIQKIIYSEKNAEKMKQYYKQFYLDHREEILKSQQKYAENNADKVKLYHKLNKDRINARRKESARIKKEQKQKKRNTVMNKILSLL